MKGEIIMKEERIEAKWIINDNDPWQRKYQCSACSNMSPAVSNYCPHCGARMKGVER